MFAISICFGRVPASGIAPMRRLGALITSRGIAQLPMRPLTELRAIRCSIRADTYGQIRTGSRAARSIPLSGYHAIDSRTLDADGA